MKRTQLIAFCFAIFAAGFCVRWVVWQNNAIAMDEVQYNVTPMYQADARALAGGDIRTFLQGADPPSDARILTHPPGYSLLMAPVLALSGDNIEAFRLAQIGLSSLAPILLFLIALELFGVWTGAIAALLGVFSPQLAYYSGILLPDGICVLPLLAAIYVLARRQAGQRMSSAVLVGVLIGISCWLRSNAMLLPVFVILAIPFLIAPGRRLKFAATILVSFLVVIAPITLRNAIVFRSFVPLSLGMGHMIVVGIGNSGDTGLPKGDDDEIVLDAERDGRPDYIPGLYTPDGIKRERERLGLGLGFIKEHPAWFASMAARRSLDIFRMERVPVIAPERDERDTTTAFYYQINRPLKLLQRGFITATILPLVLIGFAVLFVRKDFRSLVLLATIPVYYLCIQSLIYTEHRFILAVPHFWFLFVAVGIGAVVDLAFRGKPAAAATSDQLPSHDDR